MNIEKLSSKEFINLIYKGKGLPQFPNKDLKENIHYFSFSFDCDDYSKDVFIVCKEKNKIIGIIKVCVNDNQIDGIAYCSVHKEYKNKGISKLMSNKLFELYSNQTLKSSGYTQNGYDYLRPRWIKLAKQYNVNFIDKDEVSYSNED